MSQALLIRYDQRLIEEAVFLALRNQPEARKFQQERGRLYEIADWQEKNQRFGELNQSWFVRLGLDKVIMQALHEQPLISLRESSCLIGYVAQAKEEGAELFVFPEENLNRIPGRIVTILLRPESMLEPESLLVFLRRELFHISDMFDPSFAYEPTLPKAEGGPSYDTLIVGRYRTLWDVTISGRMSRLGWCDGNVRTQQFNAFVRAFPMLQDRGAELFDRFFNLVQPRHSELAAFAFDPRSASSALTGGAVPDTHCPLCRFPTHAYEPEPNDLGAEVLAFIKQDFPRWTPSLGLCVQCADLYRSRRMSMDALRLLPGNNSASEEKSSGMIR